MDGSLGLLVIELVLDIVFEVNGVVSADFDVGLLGDSPLTVQVEPLDEVAGGLGVVDPRGLVLDPGVGGTVPLPLGFHLVVGCW